MDIIARRILKKSLNSIKSRVKLVEKTINRNIDPKLKCHKTLFDLDIRMAVNELVLATTNFSIDVTQAINNSRKEK